MLPVDDVLMISVVVGELIHNLRSALGYSIYGSAVDSKRLRKIIPDPRKRTILKKMGYQESKAPTTNMLHGLRTAAIQRMQMD
jgi:hypothetical protein